MEAQIKEMKLMFLSNKSTKGFSLLAGINRPIAPSHVTKLATSIDHAKMVTRPVLIANINFLDGKNVKYIIDGQHLYTACMRLNIDIPYVEIGISDINHLVETIALHNASSKSWTLLDYVQSWKIVNKDYVTLQQLYVRYDIELSQIAEILHKGYSTASARAGGSIAMAKLIKAGTFSVRDKDASIILLNRITDALKIVPRMDRGSNKLFITTFSMYSMQPNYDHKATLNFLKANKDKFALSTQDPEEFNKLFDKIK